MPGTFRSRLRHARVHVGGTGRIGSGVILGLHAAGVGEISCNDPQLFEREQLESCVFSRPSDLGRPKVHVLERFLDGRADFAFTPIVARNQSLKVRPYLEQAHVIVSCANDLSARLYLERMAIRLGKPCVQACAQDARTAMGGLISVWVPEANCSCFGCLFPDSNQTFRRGEILLPTVTASIGALAAQIAVELLGSKPTHCAETHNLFPLDLKTHRMEAISVNPRAGCKICGKAAKR